MRESVGNEFLLEQVTFQGIQPKGLPVLQCVVLFIEPESQPAPDKIPGRAGKEIDQALQLYAAHLFAGRRKWLVEKPRRKLVRNRAQTAARRRVGFRVAKQPFDLAVEIPWAERVQPMLSGYPLASGF